MKTHRVSDEELREFDALYHEKDPFGRHYWNALVEGLRELRRAIDAGGVVEVDGRAFKDSGSFYNWAHGRYHALEDGCDKWILSDD